MAGSKSFAEGLSQRRIFREVGPGRPRHNSNDDDLHWTTAEILLLLGLSKNCRAEVSLRKRQHR